MNLNKILVGYFNFFESASALPLELARENYPGKYGKYLRTLDDILAHQDDPPEESKKEEHHQLLKTS